MGDRRTERQRVARRALLERVVGLAEASGLGAVEPEALGGGGGLRSLGRLTGAEDLFFQDEDDFQQGFLEVLHGAGLAEACLAMARHQQEDRDLWLRRLALVAREPRLRARRQELDQAWLDLLGAHFRRWGAAGPGGERVADLEAACLLGALRGAERLWLQGGGRPVLPVLVQEALGVVWPAIYQHARRHR